MSVSNELVAYETLDEGRIARIWLNRPEAHNAQSRGLLVELDEAFLRAEADDAVRVVILAARGKNFSAGHDLGSELALAERAPGDKQLPSFRTNGANSRSRRGEDLSAGVALLLPEHLPLARSAQDHHRPGAGQRDLGAALMLIWACDLIVAADNAKFSDVVGVRMGMPGVEYLRPPLGIRRTQSQGAAADR